MEKTKWLLDTDIGSDNDDCMALGYLLARKDAELLGITTVTGESARRAMLADVMCRLAGKRVPVYPGCERPLIGQPRQSRMVSAESALIDLYPHEEHPEQNRAIAFLRETIEAHPHEIVLAAIGPLTNIALLFATYPHIPALLKSLVIMGGRYADTEACEIRKWGFVEFNIRSDPYAASIVFSADVPSKLVVGVENTCRFKIPGARAARSVSAVPFLEPISKVIATWEYAWFHDAVALWAYDHPESVAMARGDVSVVLDGAENLGTTVFTPRGSGATRLVADLSTDLFFQSYAETVGFEWIPESRETADDSTATH